MDYDLLLKLKYCQAKFLKTFIRENTKNVRTGDIK